MRSVVIAGAKVVVLTNAAGGIEPAWRPGQVVLIRDHINLTGASPLSGAEPRAGYRSRFVDLTNLYDSNLREVARLVDGSLVEGVYAGLRGPHYETPAEVALLRAAGADLVGMSTALEAIAARHLGALVVGLSLVTNLAAGVGPSLSTTPRSWPRAKPPYRGSAACSPACSRAWPKATASFAARGPSLRLDGVTSHRRDRAGWAAQA